jgi:hypothetical protein
MPSGCGGSEIKIIGSCKANHLDLLDKKVYRGTFFFFAINFMSKKITTHTILIISFLVLKHNSHKHYIVFLIVINKIKLTINIS